MGYPTEFLNMAQITAKFGPWREMGLPLSEGDIVRVSDDTQMALAVGEALVEASAGTPASGTRRIRGTRDAAAAATALTPATVEAALRKHFVAWLHDPDNNRAPGQTCLTACTNLERGLRWQDATVLGSKGCGANMRVTPVALIPGLSAEQRSGIAQLQAALTHGHPTALAASDLTAHATWLLAHDCALTELLPASAPTRRSPATRTTPTGSATCPPRRAPPTRRRSSPSAGTSAYAPWTVRPPPCAPRTRSGTRPRRSAPAGSPRRPSPRPCTASWSSAATHAHRSCAPPTRPATRTRSRP